MISIAILILFRSLSMVVTSRLLILISSHLTSIGSSVISAVFVLVVLLSMLRMSLRLSTFFVLSMIYVTSFLMIIHKQMMLERFVVVWLSALVMLSVSLSEVISILPTSHKARRLL